jgi:hypothetical protein
MNTIQSTPSERPPYVFQYSCFLGRAVCFVVLIVAIMLSEVAFAAATAEETTKAATSAGGEAHPDAALLNQTSSVATGGEAGAQGGSLLTKAMAKAAITGGTDPHGDSWLSIQHSLQQFAHPEFVLRLFLSLMLAVVCAWLIGWRPRCFARVDPLSDIEERKTFVILGVAGAIVAELSGSSATLAFVIFGIGALLRFRTVLDNPKATGKAILVVVIGLACGMGSWTMAVFVTVFCWLLLLWLDSHLTCNLTIRLGGNGDSKPLQTVVQSLLVAQGCRLHGCSMSKGKKRLEFLFQMPARLDRDLLEAEVRAKLPKTDDSEITIKVV